MCRSSSQDCNDRGWCHGNAPLPPKVVTTGALSFSASRRSLPDASARTTPPPAMIAGRAARESRSAATAVSSGRGTRSSGVASIAVTTGSVVSASRTSCGISTHTGPCGAVRADFQAAARAEGICEGVRTVWTDFTTPRNEAAWSGSSWRYPCRPPPRPAVGIWLLIASTGALAAAASWSAASDVSAPGPVESSSGAASPVIRPYASAAKPALFSTRRPTYRREERRSASNMPRACWPGRPKTVVAPSPASVSTTRSPPLRPGGGFRAAVICAGVGRSTRSWS